MRALCTVLGPGRDDRYIGPLPCLPENEAALYEGLHGLVPPGVAVQHVACKLRVRLDIDQLQHHTALQSTVVSPQDYRRALLFRSHAREQSAGISITRKGTVALPAIYSGLELLAWPPQSCR
jgi:hypothetical protein